MENSGSVASSPAGCILLEQLFPKTFQNSIDLVCQVAIGSSPADRLPKILNSGHKFGLVPPPFAKELPVQARRAIVYSAGMAIGIRKPA